MTAPSRDSPTKRELDPGYQRYGPHRAGLRPLAPFVQELRHRRTCAAEMSKTGMRVHHTSTFFGPARLILNPLRLAGVYCRDRQPAQSDVLEGRWLHRVDPVGMYPAPSRWISSAAWALAVSACGFLFFLSPKPDVVVRLD